MPDRRQPRRIVVPERKMDAGGFACASRAGQFSNTKYRAAALNCMFALVASLTTRAKN
jgi:hypothetical protein